MKQLFMTRQARLVALALPLTILFVLFFILYTGPISEGDCYWHLATGRWIAEHHAIPKADPFSFTVTDHNPFRPESKRVEFLLKQYWLGQLAMFEVWQAGGNAGIILLRATVYTAILIFIFIWMRRSNQGIFPVILTFLTGYLLRKFSNERPQLFSFLFVPLVLYLLEAASNDRKPRRLVLMALPVTMLVWANTHGAYILGDVIILLYLVSHGVVCAIRRSRPDYPFLASAAASLAASVINPAGILAWTEFFHTLSAYSDSIHETLSPVQAAIRLHEMYPAYWIYMIILVACLLAARRKMELRHLLVLSALAALSMTGLRYLAFPLLAAPLLCRYLPEIPFNVRNVTTIVAGSATLLFITWSNQILEFKALGNFPLNAVAFIRQKTPAPQIFNYYDWGGYLTWSIPELKTFVDGRGLVEEFSDLHDETLSGKNWRDTLDRYHINTVIIPGMHLRFPGDPYPLALYLTGSADWHLVFADDISLVFVRDVPANKNLIAQDSLDRLALQLHLLKIADTLIKKYPNHEELWLTKANALQLLGDRQAALAAYNKTLQLNPDNRFAKRMLYGGSN